MVGPPILSSPSPGSLGHMVPNLVKIHVCYVPKPDKFTHMSSLYITIQHRDLSLKAHSCQIVHQMTPYV
jgi:hypothetical protein